MRRTIVLLLLNLGLYGCMPRPPVADNPLQGFLPAGPQALYVMPSTQRPRVAVLALHGLKGTAGVFAQPASAWANAGIVTYAVTLAHPDVGADQVHTFIDTVRTRHPGLPLIVLGESLGASLAVIALAHPGAPRVDAIVLTAPAIWPDALSGAAALQGLDMMAALGGRSALYWRRVVAMMNQAREDALRLAPPHVLVLAGGRDEVVSRSAVELLVRRLRGAEFLEFPEGGHTLFRNEGGGQVADQVASWMLAQAASIALPTAVSAAEAAPPADHAHDVSAPRR